MDTKNALAALNQETRRFWLVLKPAEDLPGQWVGHCLDLDVVTQGKSLQHAVGMLLEAVTLTLIDDLEQGLDYATRRAPQPFWDDLQRIIRAGKQVPLSEMLSSDGELAWKALALQIHFQFSETREVSEQSFSAPVVEPLCV
jgi:predicted RNase H-like HicB family nuclease